MSSDHLQEIIGTIARDCIAVRVRIINRLISAVYDEAIRPFGLKVSQMNVLVASAAFGSAKPSELCAMLHLDPSTLSRNVERLKKRGLLETVPGEDSRTHLVKIVPKGLETIEDAYPSWVAAQEKATAILGEEGVTALMDLGNRLFGRVGSDHDR